MFTNMDDVFTRVFEFELHNKRLRKKIVKKYN